MVTVKVGDIQETNTDFALAKWMTPYDFMANIATLLGKKRPETRNELAAFLKTPEGKDSYLAQTTFQGLSISKPYDFSPLRLRMPLEVIKSNASNLRLLPGKNADLMKAWARACSSYVRYSRAMEATDRIPLDEIDHNEPDAIISATRTEVAARMGIADKWEEDVTKAMEEALLKDGRFWDALNAIVVPVGMREAKGPLQFFFRVILEPSEGWITRKDADTLIDMSKVESKILDGDWTGSLKDIIRVVNRRHSNGYGAYYQQEYDASVRNYIETLKAKMKNRLKTQVPAYAIALASK